MKLSATVKEAVAGAEVKSSQKPYTFPAAPARAAYVLTGVLERTAISTVNGSCSQADGKH